MKSTRQVLLEAAQHDLMDALQVLSVADGARDVLQQAQTAELGTAVCALGQLDLLQHVVERIGQQVKFLRPCRAARTV